MANEQTSFDVMLPLPPGGDAFLVDLVRALRDEIRTIKRTIEPLTRDKTNAQTLLANSNEAGGVAWGPSATAWVPTITNSGGGGFTTTVQAARYQQVGKMVMFVLVFTVTAIGGGGYMSATLPVTATAQGGSAAGVETAIAGVAVVGNINGANLLNLRTYNNGSAIALNAQVWLSGVYEAA